MPKRSTIEARVVEFFQMAPPETARAVLNIVREVVRQREESLRPRQRKPRLEPGLDPASRVSA